MRLRFEKTMGSGDGVLARASCERTEIPGAYFSAATRGP
jgi:hypothetical protein